jgi:hypothetical protein
MLLCLFSTLLACHCRVSIKNTKNHPKVSRHASRFSPVERKTHGTVHLSPPFTIPRFQWREKHRELYISVLHSQSNIHNQTDINKRNLLYYSSSQFLPPSESTRSPPIPVFPIGAPGTWHLPIGSLSFWWLSRAESECLRPH